MVKRSVAWQSQNELCTNPVQKKAARKWFSHGDLTESKHNKMETLTGPHEYSWQTILAENEVTKNALLTDIYNTLQFYRGCNSLSFAWDSIVVVIHSQLLEYKLIAHLGHKYIYNF